MTRNTEAITEEFETPDRPVRETAQDHSGGPVNARADHSIGNGSPVADDHAVAGETAEDGAAVASDRAGEHSIRAEGPADDRAAVTDGSAAADRAGVADEPVPGDVPPVPGLWRADEAESFRARWREVQLHFVDDPRLAATEADELVSDAISALTNSLAARREDLAGWQSTGAPSTSTELTNSTGSAESSDTEALRVAVQRYRSFLDNLLNVERTDSRR